MNTNINENPNMGTKVEEQEAIETKEETTNQALEKQNNSEEKELGGFDKFVNGFTSLFSKENKQMEENLEVLLLEKGKVIIKNGMAFTDEYINIKNNGYKLVKNNVVLIVKPNTDINRILNEDIIQYLVYGDSWAINVNKEVIEKTKIEAIKELTPVIVQKVNLTF